MGNLREAIAAGERAVAVEHSWRTLTAKASVHRANDQPELAVPLFDGAARLDPTDTAALMQGARTLGEAGRFMGAAKWFSRVVERDSHRTDARVWRAYSAFCGSKDPRHVKVVRDGIRKEPDDDLAKRLFAEMTASYRTHVRCEAQPLRLHVEAAERLVGGHTHGQRHTIDVYGLYRLRINCESAATRKSPR